MQPKNLAGFDFYELDEIGLEAKRIRDNTPEAKRYESALAAVAGFIKSVAKCGDLPFMLDVEKRIQTADLLKYATTPKERAHVEDGLKQLESGLRKYQQLIETPDVYQNDAKTYYRNERDGRRDVPKDGMRKALASQKPPITEPDGPDSDRRREGGSCRAACPH